jgi:hypothetical protein
MALNNYASLLRKMDRIEEAEPLKERARAISPLLSNRVY